MAPIKPPPARVGQGTWALEGLRQQVARPESSRLTACARRPRLTQPLTAPLWPVVPRGRDPRARRPGPKGTRPAWCSSCPLGPWDPSVSGPSGGAQPDSCPPSCARHPWVRGSPPWGKSCHSWPVSGSQAWSLGQVVGGTAVSSKGFSGHRGLDPQPGPS